jgi:hypothetical protein
LQPAAEFVLGHEAVTRVSFGKIQRTIQSLYKIRHRLTRLKLSDVKETVALLARFVDAPCSATQTPGLKPWGARAHQDFRAQADPLAGSGLQPIDPLWSFVP